MGNIYLVRHGQASFASDDYDELSPFGIKQSQVLGDWFQRVGRSFDRIIVGDLKRHRQTAEACFSTFPETTKSSIFLEVDAGFNEFDHQDTLTRYWPEFSRPANIRKFFSEREDANKEFYKILEGAMLRWIGGYNDSDYRESWPMFRTRCLASFNRLLAKEILGKNIIVFTSGGPIVAIIQQLLGLTDWQMLKLGWAITNCSITRISHKSDSVSLSYFNNYAHLECANNRDLITFK